MNDKFILPCNNCITLSICKGITTDMYNEYDKDIPKGVLAYALLRKKCSIIEDYISPKLIKWDEKELYEDIQLRNKGRLNALMKDIIP